MMHEAFRTNIESQRGDEVGYRIVYGPDPVTSTERTGTARIRVQIAVCFLLFAGLVRLLWPEGREVLAMHLVTEEPTRAQTAFADLLENLRCGFGMVDSLTVFCREILYEIV